MRQMHGRPVQKTFRSSGILRRIVWSKTSDRFAPVFFHKSDDLLIKGRLLGHIKRTKFFFEILQRKTLTVLSTRVFDFNFARI